MTNVLTASIAELDEGAAEPLQAQAKVKARQSDIFLVRVVLPATTCGAQHAFC